MNGECPRIEEICPNLKTAEYQKTSDEDEAYNCIAWALHDTRQWWWPSTTFVLEVYWPPDMPLDNTRETVIKIFEIHGYTRCETDEHEIGYEKVAIYELPESGVEHVARQLQDGRWTSKIGEWEDITHTTLGSVESKDYGEVVQIMKRHRPEWVS